MLQEVGQSQNKRLVVELPTDTTGMMRTLSVLITVVS